MEENIVFEYQFSIAFYDHEILKEEITALSLPMPVIIYDSLLQRLTLKFSSPLSNDENDSFSILIANHSPELERAKRDKKAAIDIRTDELIAQGCPFNGDVFSLSLAAQANWIGMLQAYDLGLLTFPYEVSTMTGNQKYTFQTVTEFKSFYGTGMYVINVHVGGGRSLKEQVVAATTVQGVADILDNR